MTFRAPVSILFIAAAIAALSTSSASARPNIDLVLVNDTDTPFDVTVITQDNAAPTDIGRVEGKATVHYALPVKDNDTVQVINALPNSANLQTQSQTTRKQTPSVTFHLAIGPNATLVPSDSDRQLVSDLAKIGPPSDLPALPTKTAVDTLLGAIALQDASTTGVQPPYVVSPKALGTSVDSGSVSYGAYSNSYHVLVSTTLGSGGNVNIPAIVQFGVNFSSNALYQVDYMITDAGPMSAVLPKTFGQALQALDASDKAAICISARNMKAPQLLYITTLYGVKSATFTTKQGTEIKKGGTVGGNIFVTGNVAYDFQNSSSNQDTVTESVTNYMGNTVPSSVLCAQNTTVPLQAALTGGTSSGGRQAAVAFLDSLEGSSGVGNGGAAGVGNGLVVKWLAASGPLMIHIGVQQRMLAVQPTASIVAPSIVKALYKKAGKAIPK